MGDKSAIEWTDATWNPTTGCTHISAGCDHCYAETLSLRLQKMGVAKYQDGFAVRLHPDVLDQPRKWKTPRRIFVNSMSDLFHAHVPAAYVEVIWQVMADCPQHTFQVLTKRPDRMARFTASHPVSPNVWLGTSVEDHRVKHRIEDLRACSSAIRFLSCEPLIGPLGDLDLTGIHWVITGGESGAFARPCEASWVRAIRDQCRKTNTAFFHKQWGGRTPKAGGRLLDGRTWAEFPELRLTGT